MIPSLLEFCFKFTGKSPGSIMDSGPPSTKSAMPGSKYMYTHLSVGLIFSCLSISTRCYAIYDFSLIISDAPTSPVTREWVLQLVTRIEGKLDQLQVAIKANLLPICYHHPCISCTISNYHVRTLPHCHI